MSPRRRSRPAASRLSALAPDENETSQSQQEQFPTTDVFAHIEVADGRIWLLPDGIEYFCGDLSEAEQKLVWAAHGVPAADLFAHNAPGVAWRTKPSWFVIATADRTVHPELQRAAAGPPGPTVRRLLKGVGGNPFWTGQLLAGLARRRARGLPETGLHTELITSVRRRRRTAWVRAPIGSCASTFERPRAATEYGTCRRGRSRADFRAVPPWRDR